MSRFCFSLAPINVHGGKGRPTRNAAVVRRTVHEVYSTTLISGTRRVENGIKRCPKRSLLHGEDHVTAPAFLGLCSQKATTNPRFHHFCRPKISQAQNGFPRLTRPVFRTRLSLLKLQILTAFLLPARLFRRRREIG